MVTNTMTLIRSK